MKMESIVSSETSALRTQTPGNYPKRNKLQWNTSLFTEDTTLWQMCITVLLFVQMRCMTLTDVHKCNAFWTQKIQSSDRRFCTPYCDTQIALANREQRWSCVKYCASQYGQHTCLCMKMANVERSKDDNQNVYENIKPELHWHFRDFRITPHKYYKHSLQTLCAAFTKCSIISIKQGKTKKPNSSW